MTLTEIREETDGKELKKEKKKKEKKEKRRASWLARLEEGLPHYDYYRLQIKFTNEFLGTTPPASIQEKYTLKKNQKMIQEGNRLKERVTKSLAKYQGTVITPNKEIMEIKGTVVRFMELIGRQVTSLDELPDDIDDLMVVAKEVEAAYREIIGDDMAGLTVFQRHPDGKGGNRIAVSSHIFLGHMKAICELRMSTTPEGEEGILKYQNQIGNVFSTDVKPVEYFLYPDQDIIRHSDGSPLLCERVVRFQDKKSFKEISAINRSEQLPAGTKLGMILRVHKDSPIGQKEIEYLFDHGKNSGLGAWRGSGMKGTFVFIITHLPNYQEPLDPEGYR